MPDKIIDQEFVRLLSLHTEQFKQVKPTLWRFRCPFCGDSQKSKTKARCYVYDAGDSYAFHCHNCGEHGGIYKILNHVQPALAKEYSMKSFFAKGESNKNDPVYKSKPVASTATGLNIAVNHGNDIPLQSIAKLPDNHPAKIWLKRRQIPEKFFVSLYYTDDFLETAKTLKADKNPAMITDERIVIPIRNQSGMLVAIQGSAFKESSLRYITLKIKDEPKIYGADVVDSSRPVLVLEGAYDSMFLPNSVAVLDSSLEKTPFKNEILVFDNEPFSKEIIGKMEKAISHGKNVTIWPREGFEKDINESVKAGIDPDDIYDYIMSHNYNGIRANLELMKWKRI